MQKVFFKVQTTPNDFNSNLLTLAKQTGNNLEVVLHGITQSGHRSPSRRADFTPQGEWVNVSDGFNSRLKEPHENGVVIVVGVDIHQQDRLQAIEELEKHCKTPASTAWVYSVANAIELVKKITKPSK